MPPSRDQSLTARQRRNPRPARAHKIVTVSSRARPGVDWRRAEFVLTFLGVLGLITLGMPTGLSIVDRPLGGRSMFAMLRVLLVVLSVGAGVMCFRVGDLGAKAVWQGRVQAAQPAAVGELTPAP